MIDIHSHILPSVDDGSKSLESSLTLLSEMYNGGTRKVILTPHYKVDRFETSKIQLIEKFNAFKEQVSNKFEGLELYLGQEIFCSKEVYKLLKEDKLLTLAGSKALLLEFPLMFSCDIVDYVYNFKALGYTPIVAHVERYSYAKDVKYLQDIKENGGLLQVNAGVVVGKDGFILQKKVLKLIKLGLIDFIAGDIHEERNFSMLSAYKLIEKKFGKPIADNLFINNANKYIFNN